MKWRGAERWAPRAHRVPIPRPAAVSSVTEPPQRQDLSSGSDLARELFGSYLANICEMSANVFLLGVHLRTCVEHTDGDVYKERGGKGEVNTLKKLEYLNICFLIVIW